MGKELMVVFVLLAVSATACADELKIVEKPIANSLVHQYDCSVYLCGSPIVAKDNIVLKAE